MWDYRFALGGMVGVCLAAVSFVLDGHTASEGPRWLHAIANLTHVTTAAIWAGGVAMLALATLVAAAAAGGAFNHRIIVPALDRNPDHQPTIDRFRTVVTFEAAALLAVAIVTAFLIAASST